MLDNNSAANNSCDPHVLNFLVNDRNPTSAKLSLLMSCAAYQSKFAHSVVSMLNGHNKSEHILEAHEYFPVAELLSELPLNRNEVFEYPTRVRARILAPKTPIWIRYLDRYFSLSPWEEVLYNLALYQRKTYLEHQFVQMTNGGYATNEIIFALLKEIQSDIVEGHVNFAPMRYLWRGDSIKVQLYLVAAALGMTARMKADLIKLLRLASQQLEELKAEASFVFAAFENLANNFAFQVGLYESQKTRDLNEFFFFNAKAGFIVQPSFTRYEWYAALYNGLCMRYLPDSKGLAYCLSHHLISLDRDPSLHLALLLPSTVAFGARIPNGRYLFDSSFQTPENLASKLKVAINLQRIYFGNIQANDANMDALNYLFEVGFERFVGPENYFIAVNAMDYGLMGSQKVHMLENLLVSQFFDFSEPPYTGEALFSEEALQAHGKILSTFLPSLKENGSIPDPERLYHYIYNYRIFRTPILRLNSNANRFELQRASTLGLNLSGSQYLHDNLVSGERFLLDCILTYLEIVKDRVTDLDAAFKYLAVVNLMRPKMSMYTPLYVSREDITLKLLNGDLASCLKIRKRRYRLELNSEYPESFVNAQKPLNDPATRPHSPSANRCVHSDGVCLWHEEQLLLPVDFAREFTEDTFPKQVDQEAGTSGKSPKNAKRSKSEEQAVEKGAFQQELSKAGTSGKCPIAPLQPKDTRSDEGLFSIKRRRVQSSESLNTQLGTDMELYCRDGFNFEGPLSRTSALSDDDLRWNLAMDDDLQISEALEHTLYKRDSIPAGSLGDSNMYLSIFTVTLLLLVGLTLSAKLLRSFRKWDRL